MTVTDSTSQSLAPLKALLRAFQPHHPYKEKKKKKKSEFDICPNVGTRTRRFSLPPFDSSTPFWVEKKKTAREIRVTVKNGRKQRKQTQRDTTESGMERSVGCSSMCECGVLGVRSEGHRMRRRETARLPVGPFAVAQSNRNERDVEGCKRQ